MRLVTVLLVCIAAGACGRVPPPAQFIGHTMGTTYSVTVSALPRGVRRETLKLQVDEALDEVNRHFSTYDAQSEISALNASATTEPVVVSARFRELVVTAMEVSSATGGAFDITVGPLVEAWGFGREAAVMNPVPQAETISALRSAVGYWKLELGADGRSVRKAVAGLQLDVNGIAPGLAVDLIAERFEALGCQDYLVELGGEVRARGRSPAGRSWRVAVETPLSGERKPYALLKLDNLGVSTSGDYRDFREVHGRRLSHTIDPRTGAPVTHALASVSVVHPSAALADAYSTALMVLGPEEGMELAGRLGLAALFIERNAHGPDFTEHSTPAFERLRRPLR